MNSISNISNNKDFERRLSQERIRRMNSLCSKEKELNACMEQANRYIINAKKLGYSTLLISEKENKILDYQVELEEIQNTKNQIKNFELDEQIISDIQQKISDNKKPKLCQDDLKLTKSLKVKKIHSEVEEEYKEIYIGFNKETTKIYFHEYQKLKEKNLINFNNRISSEIYKKNIKNDVEVRYQKLKELVKGKNIDDMIIRNKIMLYQEIKDVKLNNIPKQKFIKSSNMVQLVKNHKNKVLNKVVKIIDDFNHEIDENQIQQKILLCSKIRSTRFKLYRKYKFIRDKHVKKLVKINLEQIRKRKEIEKEEDTFLEKVEEDTFLEVEKQTEEEVEKQTEEELYEKIFDKWVDESVNRTIIKSESNILVPPPVNLLSNRTVEIAINRKLKRGEILPLDQFPYKYYLEFFSEKVVKILEDKDEDYDEDILDLLKVKVDFIQKKDKSINKPITSPFYQKAKVGDGFELVQNRKNKKVKKDKRSNISSSKISKQSSNTKKEIKEKQVVKQFVYTPSKTNWNVNFNKNSIVEVNIPTEEKNEIIKTKSDVKTRYCNTCFEHKKCTRKICNFAHNISEIHPEQCKFDLECRKNGCYFIHSNEDVIGYTNRLGLSFTEEKKEEKTEQKQVQREVQPKQQCKINHWKTESSISQEKENVEEGWKEVKNKKEIKEKDENIRRTFCKFGKRCSNNQCTFAHNYKEYNPKMCDRGEDCIKSDCRFFHPHKETKQEYFTRNKQ